MRPAKDEASAVNPKVMSLVARKVNISVWMQMETPEDVATKLRLSAQRTLDRGRSTSESPSL
jgi:hypothetical protein